MPPPKLRAGKESLESVRERAEGGGGKGEGSCVDVHKWVKLHWRDHPKYVCIRWLRGSSETAALWHRGYQAFTLT